MNHQIYKENNNNYGKHIEGLEHNQSHILSLISFVSKINMIKGENKFFYPTKVFKFDPTTLTKWKLDETNRTTTKVHSSLK